MNISSRERIAQTLRAQEQQLLRLFAYLTTTYTKSVLGVCLAFSVLAAFYTASHLEFVTGRNDLIASDKRYVQLDEEYAKEFMGIDQVVVVVEPRDVQQGKEFVTRLGELLARDTLHVQDVFYRIDTTSLEGKKLLYLSSDDLRSLHDNLEEYQDLIHELTTQPGINTLFRAINQQVSSGLVSHLVSGFLGLDSSEISATTANDKKPLKITFLLSLLQEMERALHNSTYSYHSPWAQFFGGTEELSDNGYLVSENRRFVFLMVESKETEGAGFSEDQASIVAIRQAVTSLLPEFPGLAAGVTGTKAIDNDQAVSTQADAAIATLVSFVGVALLYLLFFKRIRHPLLIVINLTVGLIWTMGFVTLTVGHLTIITVFVAPLLLGLADDFSVHFIARYEEERSQGNSVVSALYTVFEHTVPGIAAGAFTTALAFSALLLADFQGVQELGLITGGGMLLCLVATLTFLPALLMVGEIYRPWMVKPGERTLLSGSFTLLGAVLERSRWLLLVLAGVCTLGGLVALSTLSFDYNLLNLQAHGTESVEWELRIIENSERSSRDALATASTPEEAMQKAAAFEALPSVETVESVASLIPDNQDERLGLVRMLQPLLKDLPPTLPSPTPVDVPDLRRTFNKLKLKVREENDEWDPQRKPSEQDLRAVRTHLLNVVDLLRTLPKTDAQERLERFHHPLFLDFQDKWALLRNNLNPTGPITLADVPKQLKDRFVSRDGKKFLLQIYPKKNVWEREPQEEFISQLRQVDPDVTGSPVIGYESIHAMKEGYIEGGVYALIAIVIVTFFALRRPGDTLLALLPLGLGMVWTAGLMWLFDLQFNLGNLVAVPLIIGIGVENGIHLVHRYREAGERGPMLVAGSTGRSVALFSLTTIVGFGSLMVAKYYGIFSMGLLLSLAVGSVLVASLMVLPLVLPDPAPKASHMISSAAQTREEELPVQKRTLRRAAGRR